MKTLKGTDILYCPHCGKSDGDEPVSSYVIPGRVGQESRAEDQCGWCDENFEVEQVREGEYVVTAL